MFQSHVDPIVNQKHMLFYLMYLCVCLGFFCCFFFFHSTLVFWPFAATSEFLCTGSIKSNPIFMLLFSEFHIDLLFWLLDGTPDDSLLMHSSVIQALIENLSRVEQLHYSPLAPPSVIHSNLTLSPILCSVYYILYVPRT